jgi:hypothetical protein
MGYEAGKTASPQRPQSSRPAASGAFRNGTFLLPGIDQCFAARRCKDPYAFISNDLRGYEYLGEIRQMAII